MVYGGCLENFRAERHRRFESCRQRYNLYEVLIMSASRIQSSIQLCKNEFGNDNFKLNMSTLARVDDNCWTLQKYCNGVSMSTLARRL